MTYRWGRPGNAPVLLLHSLAAHSHWWDWVAALLVDRHDVVAVDFRGHGASAWADQYSFDDYVADVGAVLDVLAWPTPLVIGHSMGGYVAALLAARHPERVGALVIVDMLTGWSADMDRRARMQADRAPVELPSVAAIAERFRLAPPDTRAPADRLRHLGEAGAAERTPGRWTVSFDRRVFLHPPPDPWSFIGDIATPALVVRGEGSVVMTRDAAERLAQAMRFGESAEIPGAYHHAIVDDPEAFVRILLGWRARSTA
jgi:pimeloyl-ACP methyl ester carboxylesterase